MKPLHYKTTKVVGNEKIVVRISLADDCKNGCCDFSITCDGYVKNNQYWVESFGGASHEEILRFFPEFADFVRLHCCNSKGQPMYPVENGTYILQQDGAANGAKYLRISEEVARTLPADKDYFVYKLHELGIIAAWEKEANDAIKHLEELTGEKFEDYDEPRFTLSVSPDEMNRVKALVESGYYSAEACAERKEKNERAKREADRAELVARFDKELADLATEKRLMLLVFDFFGTTDNVIFYKHRNELAFNWTEPQFASYKRRYTSAEYADFCAKHGPDMVGITPVLKYDYRY